MHQDHGQSPDVCKGAIDLGFSSVMMDGSLEADGKTIASYDYNVEVTRKVVDMAHKRTGVTVEGELGCLGSLETMRGDKEDGHGTDATMTREQLLTDPEQAADFVKKHPARRAGHRHRHQPWRLQVHPQAHRRHPGDRPHQGDQPPHPQHPPGDARLLQRAAGPAGQIRQYGGDMKETYGVPVEEIQHAIKFGVRKINIDTDIRLAMTGAVRKYMAENPSKFDPRDWLKPAREAAKADLPPALRRVRLRRPGRQDQGVSPAGPTVRCPLQITPRPTMSPPPCTPPPSPACPCSRAARCATTTRSATTAS
jgi:fructose-bisphosphate aldolase class II